MNSRMEKYHNNENVVGKRSQKNEQLYKQVTKQSLNEFNVNSNATVLSDNGTNIDLEMLKDMLDKKYRDTNTRKPINLDFPKDEDEIKMDETKEYDINAILEKAREHKTVDYEKERLKKIRDTQYDILKSLDLSDKKEEPVEENTEEEKKLMTLINTIALNEQNSKQNDLDPLDLFQDLKGSENTQVLDGLKEDIQKNINTDKIKKVVKDEVQKEIDKSFYTKSLNLSKTDFDDFKDLQDDVKSNKVLVTILTIIIIIAFLFGIFLFLNIYFEWGII